MPIRPGGYSLCDGWYICAAVLTPFFHFGRIEHDLFGVLFLIHQQQSYLLGYKNYQFLQKSIFLAANSIFSSIFLGPIFSGQRHTPISFQAEYHPGPIRCSLYEIAATWYRQVASGHPDLHRDTPSHRQWKQSCCMEEHHDSAASLNLTIYNLEHVALVAITLGYDPLTTVKESQSIW